MYVIAPWVSEVNTAASNYKPMQTLVNVFGFFYPFISENHHSEVGPLLLIDIVQTENKLRDAQGWIQIWFAYCEKKACNVRGSVVFIYTTNSVLVFSNLAQL